ncbi:MAG: SEC-C domain-containing protein [Firmicutes bacterium HGW-Firmicutes-7]|nr:MAG: SEC-C domain-containing protein [Firmicutes bacterium HGW-Firmicutes-7]
MSIYKKWLDLAQAARTEEEDKKFWDDYFPREQKNYEVILENAGETIEGTLSELAEKFNMDAVVFTGFLDGINTSLTKPLDIESLTEKSLVTLSIDLEKLYYNMLYAKAEWLFTLPQWDGILSVEKRKAIKKEYNETRIVKNDNKISRNDPCPCGSGKKYKKCCIDK